jgi:hypothetical protein
LQPGFRLGQLWLFRYPFQPGYPTKTIIKPAKAIKRPLLLVGSRCSDGRGLRFWFYDDDRRLPKGSGGNARAVLRPHSRGRVYTGYLIFAGPGDWRLNLYSSGNTVVVLATIVLRVGAHEPPLGAS